MSGQPPFTLHIFVANGEPDGLRLVERSNWVGKGIVFPRAIYASVRRRPEFANAGVYMLSGPREDSDSDAIYIGEGDPVGPRLENHYANKDFWTKGVFFIAPGQLNKAHVQCLEARLVKLAKETKRNALDNGNLPAEPTLSESDNAFVDVFLENMLGILPVLGVHAFEKASPSTGSKSYINLICQGREVRATGNDGPQGFVVHNGSTATANPSAALADYGANVIELRADLIKRGVLVPEHGALRFTQDYVFSSPSLAAAVILGRSSNGRTEWKDSSGKTLKQIQEAQVNQT